MQFRLFDLMVENHVTQQTLAINISVSQGNISDWKNGRSFPKADTLARIADYFGVSVDYLLGRTELRQPAPAAPVSPFPADAVEVAHAYAMLPSLEQKNMIRGSLHLPPIASAQTAG